MNMCSLEHKPAVWSCSTRPLRGLSGRLVGSTRIRILFLSHKLSILRSASRAVGATLCMLSTSLASARAAAPSSPLPQRAAWPGEVEGEVRGRREPPLRTHTSTHRVVGPPGQHTDRQPAFSPLPRAGDLFSRLGPARPSRSSEDGWLQSSATSMLLAARLLASQDRAVCLPRTTDE